MTVELDEHQIKMALLQDRLIHLITEYAGDEIGAAVIVLVDKRMQPFAVMSPGCPDPECTREILCRGISESYNVPLQVPRVPRRGDETVATGDAL